MANKKEAKYPARLAIAICERIYSKKIYPGTWANWRKWAECSGARMLTEGQMLKLAAIASLRKAHPTNELDSLRIDYAVANANPLICKALMELEAAKFVTGGQAIALLGVPRATAYRRMKAFSARSVYRLEDLAIDLGVAA
jgi:hypothetical protein